MGKIWRRDPRSPTRTSEAFGDLSDVGTATSLSVRNYPTRLSPRIAGMQVVYYLTLAGGSRDLFTQWKHKCQIVFVLVIV
jgi:hypothetical protein